MAVEGRTASETSRDLPPGWREVRGPARTVPRRLSGTRFTGAQEMSDPSYFPLCNLPGSLNMDTLRATVSSL